MIRFLSSVNKKDGIKECNEILLHDKVVKSEQNNYIQYRWNG